MTITISILGRPNVGKSTLFNRLAGKKLAIVDNSPGVTRDRRLAVGNIGDLQINIMDTAGFEEIFDDSLEGRMQKQANQAIKESDLVLFLIDCRAGITPLDTVFSKWIRAQNIPIILIANKYEGSSGDAGLYESYKLGLGEPIAISAEHGDGLADLYQAIIPYDHDQQKSNIAKPDDQIETELDDFSGPIQLAIVGRPNVGKSTLVNQLLGEDRVLTGPEAGITRDAISVNWQHRGR
ncbi:MAG: GTP-binding protein, partial [Rhodospirillaceae bacterium]|nr:GTP-binding protein [Rhodospirillaceae bacterium]